VALFYRVTSSCSSPQSSPVQRSDAPRTGASRPAPTAP
jgi:hypothetical protein